MFGCIDENDQFWDIGINGNKDFYWQVLKLDEDGNTVVVKSSGKTFKKMLDCIRDAKKTGGMTCEPGLKSDLVM